MIKKTQNRNPILTKGTTCSKNIMHIKSIILGAQTFFTPGVAMIAKNAKKMILEIVRKKSSSATIDVGALLAQSFSQCKAVLAGITLFTASFLRG